MRNASVYRQTGDVWNCQNSDARVGMPMGGFAVVDDVTHRLVCLSLLETDARHIRDAAAAAAAAQLLDVHVDKRCTLSSFPNLDSVRSNRRYGRLTCGCWSPKSRGPWTGELGRCISLGKQYSLKLDAVEMDGPSTIRFRRRSNVTSGTVG